MIRPLLLSNTTELKKRLYDITVESEKIVANLQKELAKFTNLRKEVEIIKEELTLRDEMKDVL